MKCKQCGSTAIDHTENQCRINQGNFSIQTGSTAGTDKWITTQDTCLHKNCQGCKNGTCNGVHMISCPCPSCSPVTMCVS